MNQGWIIKGAFKSRIYSPHANFICKKGKKEENNF